ncbi:GNAT family N-acetyltransferase [Leptolyngbya sp. GB1-A1]|uniref:GNAT family N-acetyltransferase n=1 Tax=Leptolyngbya sp. GB1-A1 TaxID=2933908 RepID=UPI003299C122
MAYKDTIPPQLYREPWMSEQYFEEEISRGVQFLGFEENQSLVGVMGVQDVKDVTLIRHSYVRTSQRGKGIGGALLNHHIAHSSRPILVGCLKAMTWAISFYQKHGFTLVSDAQRDELRARYWNLSSEHVKNSVVLADRKWLAGYEVV